MNCIKYSGIDYTKYFNHTVQLQRKTDSNSDYTPDGEYGPVENILCWVGGSSKFYRENTQQFSIASKSYRTLTPVKEGDLLDGQVVIYSYTKYGLDGNTIEFYKLYVE